MLFVGAGLFVYVFIQVSFVCGWHVKLCDPIVTHRPYLSALEIKGL